MKTQKLKKSPKDYHYDYIPLMTRWKPEFYAKLEKMAKASGFRTVPLFVKFLISQYVNSPGGK
jgi:hypothetical protein